MSDSKIKPDEEMGRDSGNNDLERSNDKSITDSISEILIKAKPYLAIIWYSRKKIIILNSIIFILALAYLIFISKPYYTSSVTILPDYGNKSSDMMGSFSGLAAMAGVSVGDTPPTQIYQNLLTSEAVLSDVIYTKYQTQEFTRPVNLIEYFGIEPDKALPKELAKRKNFLTLFQSFTKTAIAADLDKMTKILTISVTMPESKLSAEIANNIVKSLDQYVRTKRKSFASNQRKYLELRVSQVKDTLTYFEEKLKDFRTQNRITVQSPELILAQARLARNVEIQQTVFAELTKQLELVKLSEVKDTPVVNVREPAQEPVIKAGPKRLSTLIIICFFSFVITCGYYLIHDDIRKVVRRVKRGEISEQF